MADLIQFDAGSGARIGQAVRWVEEQAPRARPLAFSETSQPPRRIFRVCTFTGEWSKNTAKVVTFKHQTSTPNTVAAMNLFANVAAGGNCAIAREGTAWFLIAAEC